MSFGFMPAFAFGATATILVGQHVGKGNPFMARRLGTETAILGSIMLITIGIIEFFFAEPIARLFSPDPEIFHLVTRLIMISAFLQLFDGFLNFYAGGLRGLGDTTFLMKALSFLVYYYSYPYRIFLYLFRLRKCWSLVILVYVPYIILFMCYDSLLSNGLGKC